MPIASEIDKPVNLNISDGVKPNRTKFDTLYYIFAMQPGNRIMKHNNIFILQASFLKCR